MGFIRHNAIVVTYWKREDVEKAHAKAKALGMQVTEILVTTVNSYASFLIGPDGSKEGWDESNEGNRRRAVFFQEIRGMYIDAVEINYGGDGGPAFIERDLKGHEEEIGGAT